MKDIQSQLACVVVVLGTCAILGCGPAPPQETASQSAAVATPSSRPAERAPLGPSEQDVAEADLAILFFGNSHTGMHDVPGIVRGLAAAAHAEDDDYQCFTSSRSGITLKDINASEHNHELIREREWDVVVLQGQEISTSGRFTYPLDPAIELADTATESGKRVFLFAEWARDGVDERERFENVYREIATKCEATVVPIGQAFELAAADRPDLVLHAADGNHSSPAGAYLAACMLYGAITGEKLAEIPNADTVKLPSDVPAADRRFLRKIADQALAEEAARETDG